MKIDDHFIIKLCTLSNIVLSEKEISLVKNTLGQLLDAIDTIENSEMQKSTSTVIPHLPTNNESQQPEALTFSIPDRSYIISRILPRS